MFKQAKLLRNLLESDVTDESLFRDRRAIVKAMGILPIAGFYSGHNQACEDNSVAFEPISRLNSLYEISNYNNYYEFSTNKQAVALLAKEMKLRPWTISISGEVENPVTVGIEDLLARQNIVERIYRFRCVEGWSMVIPWNGFQLCDLLKQVKPKSTARYVQFVSHVDENCMIGMRRTGLQFPYLEGLRIDEAMHPLTLMATGIYGKDMPAQNGAPVRLVVPWKYGYKSSKAIVKIILTEKMPATSWNRMSPQEYGFYANVNPRVSHPRWSQRRENRIGELKKIKTLLFNGYQQQVAHLYNDLDLKKYF